MIALTDSTKLLPPVAHSAFTNDGCIFTNINVLFNAECGESADVNKGSIVSVSDYEVIERTDPYLDYCQINEYDTMSNVNPSIGQYDSKESARSESPDAWSEHSLTENLPQTSSDLLGSISREISKRGIDLHKKQVSNFPSMRSSKRKVPKTPPMPCRGPKQLRLFSDKPQTTEAEVHRNSSVEQQQYAQ
jgi:hypothetical protein